MNDVQVIELKLLDEFIRVCDELHLSWFADSGTLLGAIRKGKMIPWDDDVDVIMPREDYDIFIKEASTLIKPDFFLQNPLTDNCFTAYTKLRYDESTVFEKRKHESEHDYDYHKGLAMDIFVLDAVPDDDTFLCEQYFLRFIYNKSCANKIGHRHFSPDLHRRELFSDLNLMLSDVSYRHYDSEYVANLFCNRSSEYMGIKLRREWYNSYLLKEFEGLSHLLRIPVGFEGILRTWYGEDWRIEKHDPNSHDLENCFHDAHKSYKEYEELSREEYDNLFKKS